MRNVILAASAITILACGSPVLAGGELTATGPSLSRECPPYPPANTGQAGCWDEDGNAIGCAGTGQDGDHQAGVSVNPRFTDNGDGTVTDNVTGLTWLRKADCFWMRNWATALADANTLADGSCELIDGSLAGEWRLPNVRELLSLLDHGQTRPALSPGHPFSGVQPDYYWSSTSYADYPDGAWAVILHFGNVNVDNKANTRYVWPVRGGQ